MKRKPLTTENRVYQSGYRAAIGLADEIGVINMAIAVIGFRNATTKMMKQKLSANIKRLENDNNDIIQAECDSLELFIEMLSD